jgi:hypothetical protein
MLDRIALSAFAVLAGLLAVMMSACGVNNGAATPATAPFRQAQLIFFYTDG